MVHDDDPVDACAHLCAAPFSGRWTRLLKDSGPFRARALVLDFSKRTSFLFPVLLPRSKGAHMRVLRWMFRSR